MNIEIGDLYRAIENDLFHNTPIKAITTSKINEGWVSEIYSLKVNYEDELREHSKDYILKAYPNINNRDKPVIEFNVMKKLHGLGINIPEVFFIEQNMASKGIPFIIMEKIEGTTLKDLLPNLSNPRKYILLKKLCAMLTELHSIDYSLFNELSFFKDKHEIERNIVNSIKYAMREIELYDLKGFYPILKWLQSHTPKETEIMPSLIHGDYNQTNVIVDDNENYFLIDWTTSRVDDLRFDLSSLIVSNDIQIRESFLSIYKKYSKIDINSIEFFEVFEAVKQLAIVVRVFSEGIRKVGFIQSAEKDIKDVHNIYNLYEIIRINTGFAIPEVENILREQDGG